MGTKIYSKGVAAMNYRIEEKEEIRIVGVKKWFSTVNNQQLKEYT